MVFIIHNQFTKTRTNSQCDISVSVLLGWWFCRFGRFGSRFAALCNCTKMRKNSQFNYSFTADTTKVKLFPVVGFLPEETERCWLMSRLARSTESLPCFLQKKGEKQMIMCSIDCLSNPISSLPCYERCCPCYEKTRPMVGRVPDGWTSSAAMPSWPVNHVCCWLRKSFPLSPTLAYKNERINSNKHFHFQSSNHDKRT